MLTSEKIIIETSGDLEVVWIIVAGFDYLNNFVVQYCCMDYEKGKGGFEISAIVDEEDAKVMANHLKVSLVDLPQTLYDEFGDATEVAVSSEMEGIFKDILDYILDCGAKYKLKK